MSLYRLVYNQVWTDSKVVDDYTADDLYFWVYLLTNPQTNLIGCYEFTISLASYQMKWKKEKVWEYLKRFCEVHRTVGYDETTKEIIIFNWGKYNWNSSPKVISAVKNQAVSVKKEEYRKYILELVNGGDMVCIPYGYGMYTITNANAIAITNPSLFIQDKTNTTNKERIQERKDEAEPPKEAEKSLEELKVILAKYKSEGKP